MKKFLHIIGTVVFWVTWPVLYLILRFSRRTRVFIRCNDELLVLKDWLGNDTWVFPGGGVHRGEDPRLGAVREVQEEVGIDIGPEELTFIFERPIYTPQKMRFTCFAYGIDLKEKPTLEVKKQLEVAEVEWRPIKELLEQPSAKYLLAPALSAWKNLS